MKSQLTCVSLFIKLSIYCLLSKSTGAQDFEEVAEAAGISYIQTREDFRPVVDFPFHLLSGGAAAGDFDNDGWIDLFVTRMADTDILYRNTGLEKNGIIQFEDISEQAGFNKATTTNGAIWIDIDNDGDLDIYVSTIYEQSFLLYVNQGDGSFKEQARVRGAALTSPQDHHGFSLSTGDFDKDGWTDIHTTEWLIDQTKPESVHHNVLLRNLGPNAPGFFRNETASRGVTLTGRDEGGGQFIAYGFTSNFADMDNDGWQDLVVVSDYKSSQIFWNNGDGTFADGTATAGIQLEWAGMGSTIADYDGDGLLDWFVASQSDNALYRNNGDRTFTSQAIELGIDKTDWSWGTSWIDYDNDGDQDLIVTNGLESHDGFYQISSEIDLNYLFRNDNGSFTNAATELGVADDEAGKGLLTFDFDNDGDLDVFIVNNERRPFLYRNNSINDNRWLRVKLQGRTSNPAGYGAKVYLQGHKDGNVTYQEAIGGNNFLGQNEDTLHFGLGPSIERIHSLEIRWPSGLIQRLQNIPTNQKLYVAEPAGIDFWLKRNFSEAELEDDTVADPSADPDKDGLKNLFEYAFAKNPLQADNDPELVLVKSHSTDSDTIRFNYERASDAIDLDYHYDVSVDLDLWKEAPLKDVVELKLRSNIGGTETVQVTISDLDSGRKFLRIRATLQESVE